MGFASTYLKERTLFPSFIDEAPRDNTGIIAVIPSYSEPGIVQLLDSLYLCNPPACKTEIIIVINAPADADEEKQKANLKSIEEIAGWKADHAGSFFNTYVIDVTKMAFEGWGVGMARKTGMDEAVRRFEKLDCPGGVILCLDADCTVSNTYFTAIESELLKRKERSACSIRFCHPLDGSGYTAATYCSITLYELHLRYFYQGLIYSGHPYAFHTVGSAIGVKASAYVKSGGMNRRMAGEDFYFIQKLIPAGGYFNLNGAIVFPSPRTSLRVPFGTGAAIARMTEEETPVLMTYNVQAFRELKSFFDNMILAYNIEPVNQGDIYDTFPQGIRLFLTRTEWITRINEIKNNTSGFQSFNKRFFVWFNMFRVIKYLNNVHLSYMEKEPVDVSASKLLKERGIDYFPSDSLGLLQFYRRLEENS